MAATHGEGAYGNGVGVTTPLEHKIAQAGGVVKTTAGAIRPGLFWAGNPTIVTGTAGMAYAVAIFTCASTRGVTTGALLWANDGTVNVSTTAAPGSNSRIDIIYAWHREFALDGVNSDPVIGVVQGTSAAIPTAPSLAAFPGAIELARATVSAGATATNGGSVVITQTAPFTASSGGTVFFRTLAEMNAATNLPLGTNCYVIAEKTAHSFDGALWIPGSGFKRILYPTMLQTSQPSGTILGSQVIAQKPYKQRVVVSIDGLVNINPSGTVAINVLPGTGLTFPSAPAGTIPATSGSSVTYTRGYVVEIAAGSGSVTLQMQLSLSAGGSGIFNGLCTMQLQVEGEW